MQLLLDWIIKLISKTDGYKTIGGIILLLIGGLMTLWPVTALFAESVIYFALGLLGVGIAHKVTKKGLTPDIVKYSANNIHEIVVALVKVANTVADITSTSFNFDKFIKKHLNEIIDLVPIIRVAIEDAEQIVKELERINEDDEVIIIDKLRELSFPDEDAEKLAKSGIKALFYIAQIGINLP